jgi:hypothetical protein
MTIDFQGGPEGRLYPGVKPFDIFVASNNLLSVIAPSWVAFW